MFSKVNTKNAIYPSNFPVQILSSSQEHESAMAQPSFQPRRHHYGARGHHSPTWFPMERFLGPLADGTWGRELHRFGVWMWAGDCGDWLSSDSSWQMDQIILTERQQMLAVKSDKISPPPQRIFIDKIKVQGRPLISHQKLLACGSGHATGIPGDKGGNKNL